MLMGVGDLYACRKLMGRPSIVLHRYGKCEIGIYIDISLRICDMHTIMFQSNGYPELAYLHPNYFKPDENVLDFLSSENDKITSKFC